MKIKSKLLAGVSALAIATASLAACSCDRGADEDTNVQANTVVVDNNEVAAQAAADDAANNAVNESNE